MSVLMHAFNQWSTRPADQRFNSLDDLHAAVLAYQNMSVEARSVDLKSMRVSTTLVHPAPLDTLGEKIEPVLVGKNGSVARFSHYSFGQFARRISAPAEFLRQLPPALVADVMNDRLAVSEKPDDSEALLFAKNGGLSLRCLVTDKYTRIWNSDVTSRLIRLKQQSPEWQEAPAAFDGSRGMYASDHDIFCFMVDNGRRIFETDKNGGLSRGFFVSNSEVGDKSFTLTTFNYEWVCGNHRVWGAKNIAELRIPHIGNADARVFSRMQVELKKYAEGSAKEDEARILRARACEIGKDKEAVLDRVFGLRVPGLSQKMISASYDKAVEHEDWYGAPTSVWGFCGGLTEIARDKAYGDERVALDRAAGRVAQIAF